MLHGCNCKSLLAFLLSFALAFPVDLFAHGTIQPPKATHGLGVLFQKVTTDDGQTGYLVAAAVPQKHEAEVVQALGETAAKHGAGSAVLLVDGADDPALAAAKAGGVLGMVTVAEAYDPEALPALKNYSAYAKKKIASKISEITAYCREKREGLIFAFLASGALGGLTFYSSASVPAGLTVLAANFVWMSFLLTSQEAWGKTLNGGGNAVRWIGEKVLGFFGKKLSDRDKKLYELTGKFTASLIPNAVVAGIVLYGAGQLYTDNVWTILAHATFFGMLLNYNIWDAVVAPKVELGKLSTRFRDNYVRLQILLGTLLEVSSYLGFGYAQGVLAFATVSGVGYLAGQEKIEETVVPRARMLGGLVKQKKVACQTALMSAKTALTRTPATPVLRPALGHVWDDIQ